jgi:hypothetical protein
MRRLPGRPQTAFLAGEPECGRHSAKKVMAHYPAGIEWALEKGCRLFLRRVLGGRGADRIRPGSGYPVFRIEPGYKKKPPG